MITTEASGTKPNHSGDLASARPTAARAYAMISPSERKVYAGSVRSRSSSPFTSLVPKLRRAMPAIADWICRISCNPVSWIARGSSASDVWKRTEAA